MTTYERAARTVRRLEAGALLFPPAPPIFDTVIDRDFWAIQHFDDQQLLSDSDLERTLVLLDSEREPTADIGYAAKVARGLAAERRWGEASAYWYAIATVAAAYHMMSTDSYEEALAQHVACIASAAGLAVGHAASELSAVVELALESMSVPARDSVLRALLTLGAIDADLFEKAATRAQVRAKIGQVLPEAVSALERRRGEARGSHEIFRMAVGEYTRRLNAFRMAAQTLSLNSTLVAVRDGRAGMLKAAGDLQDLALPTEQPLLEDLRRLGGEVLTAYLAGGDEPTEDAYGEFASALQLLVTRTQTAATTVAVCVMAPLALALGAAVGTHYQGIVRSKRADLKVRLLKPVVAAAAARFQLEIAVANEGTTAAEECNLRLQSGPEYVLFGTELTSEEDIFVGRVRAGGTEQRSLAATWRARGEAVEVQCRLSYFPRTNPKRMKGRVRRSVIAPVPLDLRTGSYP